MRLLRPAEPAVLARARPELLRDLEKAWRTAVSRAPEPHPVLQDPDIRAPLLAMTQGRCAYCERPLEPTGPQAASITQHRPSWGAVGSVVSTA